MGYALTTYNEDTKQAVIGFDMGGMLKNPDQVILSVEHATLLICHMYFSCV